MEPKFSNLCGFDIYSGSKKDCLDFVFKKDKVHIVSGNPEVLYTALKDKRLNDNFKSNNSVIIPDGIGVKLAALFTKQYVSEKIAGIEFMESIIERCEKENKSIYLLGASYTVIDKCYNNIKAKYPNLKIEGYHSGYFDKDKEQSILNNIRETKPYALFVALGCPKQENFIISNMDSLPVNIFMGVGGSFDVISGEKKRAPKIMISLGLEWLYRAIKEPFRIKRLIVIPRFILKSILFKLKR